MTGSAARARRAVVLGLTVATLGAGLLAGAGPAAAYPGLPWSAFNGCPVDAGAMLATPAGQGVECAEANGAIDFNVGRAKSSRWSLQLQLGDAGVTPGNPGTVVPRTVFYSGDYVNLGTFVPGFDACNVLYPPLSSGWAQCEHNNTGNLGYLPSEILSDVVSINAVLQPAGTVSQFDASALTTPGARLITLPVKFRIVGNLLLGADCTIGTDADPILLRLSLTGPPASTSTSVDPHGYPVSFTFPSTSTFSDTTFSEPGATGCGPGGLLNPVVNALAGLPRKTGNHFTLVTSPGLASTTAGGAVMSQAWHAAFG